MLAAVPVPGLPGDPGDEIVLAGSPWQHARVGAANRSDRHVDRAIAGKRVVDTAAHPGDRDTSSQTLPLDVAALQRERARRELDFGHRQVGGLFEAALRRDKRRKVEMPMRPIDVEACAVEAAL
jgi:hypothetical protein